MACRPVWPQRRPETSKPVPENPPTPKQEPKKRRFLTRDVFIGVFTMLFLLGFGVWGGLQIAEMRKRTPGLGADPAIHRGSIAAHPYGYAAAHTNGHSAGCHRCRSHHHTHNQPNPEAAVTPLALIGPVRLQIIVRQRA